MFEAFEVSRTLLQARQRFDTSGGLRQLQNVRCVGCGRVGLGRPPRAVNPNRKACIPSDSFERGLSHEPTVPATLALFRLPLLALLLPPVSLFLAAARLRIDSASGSGRAPGECGMRELPERFTCGGRLRGRRGKASSSSFNASDPRPLGFALHRLLQVRRRRMDQEQSHTRGPPQLEGLRQAGGAQRRRAASDSRGGRQRQCQSSRLELAEDRRLLRELHG